MKIEISQEDYEFLKELQHELNTQTTDGNAEPVFWGVIETVEDVTDGDYDGEPYITYDDGKWSVKDAIEEIEQAMTSEFYDIDDDAKEYRLQLADEEEMAENFEGDLKSAIAFVKENLEKFFAK